MARPKKDEQDKPVTRSIYFPRDIDEEIDDYAYEHRDSRTGAVVKAWRFFAGSNNKNDSCETQGKQNGR
jgi:hypothetical protein